MLELAGEIEITKINGLTGEITEVIRKSNLIPDNTLLSILSWDAPANFFGSAKISISSQDTIPSFDNYTVEEILATGDVPNGVISSVWIDIIEPPYGIIKNRINFTGIARTFNTVALTNLSPSDDQFTSATALAYTRLDLACTQGNFEILFITYRISFSAGTGAKFINERRTRYDFGMTTFGLVSSNGRGFRMSWLYAGLFQPPSVTYDSLVPSGTLVAGLFPNTGSSDNITWSGGERIDDHYKWKYSLQKLRENDIGVIYNCLSQGISNDNTEIYNIQKYPYTQEPFQTGFWHSISATTPFFDDVDAGAISSKGSIVLSGTWAGGFPELYKIEITADGTAATATYKFSVMKHLGFIENTYTIPDTPCPFMQTAREPVLGVHGWRVEDFDKHRFSNTQVVQYDTTGVTLLNLITGVFTTWDNTTTPTLNATQIRQVEVDVENKKIYIACRTTGLWIIDVIAATLAHPLTNACYGVDVGQSGIAYALASTGLHASTDWDTPLGFTYDGISDGNWSRVNFLKADPQNDHIAIAANDGSGINKIVWYEVSTNTVYDGYTDSFYFIPSYPACLDVSDVGSRWWVYSGESRDNRLLSFGDTTYSQVTQAYYQTINHSVYGTQAFSKISFYKDSLFGLLSFAGGNVTLDYPIFGIPNISTDFISYVLHLTGGVVVTNRYIRQVFSASDFAWISYGWNGSSWAQDNNSSKTTHVAANPLINGIAIAFADAANPPQFVAGDYLTQGVNYGLLKDNATTIDSYISQWYSKEVVFDASYSGTIPSTAPYTLTLTASTLPEFLRLETDTPKLHAFKINTVAVVAVYVAGEPPGPNEVAIAPNGTVTFNAADAGKTFNAIYTYIKV